MTQNESGIEQVILKNTQIASAPQIAVRDGCWAVNSEHLYASEGIPFAGNMDIMYIANLLAGCDGRRTLRELIEAVADRMQTDPETITPACLVAVRKLMQAGSKFSY